MLPKEYIIFLIAFAALGLVVSVLHLRANRKRVNAVLSEHPDAARVTIKNVNWLFFTRTTTVLSVDGKEYAKFVKGFSVGFYLTPGVHELTVSFSKTRPGILHKQVTTIYDPVKISVTAEAGKEYRIYFNHKTEQYVFEETMG